MTMPNRLLSAPCPNGSCYAHWIFLMPSENSLRALLSGPFSYNARPEPVAGDLRMSWGIAILLLSLLISRGKKGSFQKLQFLAHAVRIAEGREDVRALLKGRLRASDISVRVE